MKLDICTRNATLERQEVVLVVIDVFLLTNAAVIYVCWL